jgi:4-amino-4-deoxy-L-arabinose transferase-like glycosyltransferase
MRRLIGRLRCLRPYAVLAGLCLLLYLPGIAAIPPLDRDEARFAQATRQMLDSGDFLHIRFQDEARNKKPAGIYWLQAAAVSLFSTPRATAIWPYRVPSLLGALVAALLTFGLGAAMLHDQATPRLVATIAALMLGTALGVVAEAHIAKTDAALLAAVTAGQGALGIAYVRGRTGRSVAPWVPLLFWGAEIAAIFLKGPVAPALAVATIAALAIADGGLRWLRRLHPVIGVIALLIAVAPWLVAIERATEGHFLADAIGGDLVTKLVGAQESHGAPPLSYLLLSLASFWPGSLLLVPALVRAWQRHDRPVERFLLAWLVPGWLFLELVPTKLPHYVLPLYPALALLAALALAGGTPVVAAGWPQRLDLIVKALWLVVTLALATLLIGLPPRFAGNVAIAGIVGAVVMPMLAAALLRTLPRPGLAACIIAALSLAFVVPAALVLPGLDRLWLSRAAAKLVARHPPAAGMPLVAVGYSEPSLVFLLGTDLRLAFPGGAGAILANGGEALVSNRVEANFREATGARGLAATPLGSVAGLDYSNGQRIVLTLYDVTRMKR